MLNFEKIYSVSQALKQVYGAPDMIAAVFADCPELKSFNFTVTNEYDDNNYSDYSRLTAVNGLGVDYDGDYEEILDEDEEQEPGTGPMVDAATRASLRDLVGLISDHYGHSGEDDSDSHLVVRDAFPSKSPWKSPSTPEIQYALAHVSGAKIEDGWFLSNESKFAAFYAEDHGRFSEDMETKLFTGIYKMEACLMYAQALRSHTCRGGLPKHLEDYWMLQCTLEAKDEDKESFRKYLAQRKGA